MMLIVNVVLLY